MTSFARSVGFVVIHTAIVAAYMAWLTSALPPLATEPPELVLLPVTAIAAVMLSLAYEPIRAQRTHLGRIAVMLVAALGAMAAFAGFFVMRVEAPNPLALASLVMFFQLLYGAPLLLAVLVIAKVTSPILIARPARGWA